VNIQQETLNLLQEIIETQRETGTPPESQTWWPTVAMDLHAAMSDVSERIDREVAEALEEAHVMLDYCAVPRKVDTPAGEDPVVFTLKERIEILALRASLKKGGLPK
jgi:hypothetical protein